MIIPNADEATVSPEKVRDYLLSDLQPVGRFKAVFFRALGHEADFWEELEADLRSLLAYEAEVGAITEYGQKYVLRGSIKGPNGRSAEITTVWIILNGENRPRLVTAYPGG